MALDHLHPSTSALVNTGNLLGFERSNLHQRSPITAPDPPHHSLALLREPEGQHSPAGAADTIVANHRQPRSGTCWSRQ